MSGFKYLFAVSSKFVQHIVEFGFVLTVFIVQHFQVSVRSRCQFAGQMHSYLFFGLVSFCDTVCYGARSVRNFRAYCQQLCILQHGVLLISETWPSPFHQISKFWPNALCLLTVTFANPPQRVEVLHDPRHFAFAVNRARSPMSI